MAEKHDKPWIHVNANEVSVEAAVQIVRAWISGNEIKVMNVAGPRASKDPKIYGLVMRLLRDLLRQQT